MSCLNASSRLAPWAVTSWTRWLIGDAIRRGREYRADLHAAAARAVPAERR
ncbi:hypothetical protein [Embleya sp. NPDC005575]|uniref:hypothetical protein n=1 Tax=Embleya sp. NPDC005575 TaxID=3156892 RepID=UPI00339E1CFD